jgi:hypothetical protein
MEFYSGETQFTTGHPPESLEREALRDLGPEFTPKVIAVVQDVDRGLRASEGEKDLVEKGDRKRLSWDVRASQVAGLNLDASLIAFHAYLATVGRPIFPEGWKWAIGLSPEMGARLGRFREAEWAVTHLVESGKRAAQREPGRGRGRGYDSYDSGDQAILAVVAADTAEPILRETAKWPDFSVDEAGLRQAMGGPGSLAVAVRSNITVKQWSSVGNGVADSFVSLSSVYAGNLVQLTPLEGNGIAVSRDSFGIPTVSYSMKVSSYMVTVRITDVTHAPEGLDGEVPHYDQLVESHRTQDAWTMDTGYAGAQFNSFHLGVEQSVRHCLGAENGTWKVMAVQAGGHVKINGDCPLNLDIKSVVVFRDRGWKTTPESVGEYLDFSHQGEGHFVNLVEVDIMDRYEETPAVRVFDGLFSEKDARGND